MREPKCALSVAELENRMRSKYGSLADFVASEHLALDIIEARDDMKMLLPVLDGIARSKLSKQEFRDGLIKLWANLWHLISHLKRLEKTLKEQEERNTF